MIREYQQDDILKIKLQPAQKDFECWVDTINKRGINGRYVTYTEGAEVKACIGIIMMWPGRYQAWALIGDVDNWTAFHRQTVRELHKAANELSIRRMEMTTEEGFIESERWAEMLGFEYESTMPKFGIDGKTHKMWVMLWHGHH